MQQLKEVWNNMSTRIPRVRDWLVACEKKKKKKKKLTGYIYVLTLKL